MLNLLRVSIIKKNKTLRKFAIKEKSKEKIQEKLPSLIITNAINMSDNKKTLSQLEMLSNNIHSPIRKLNDPYQNFKKITPKLDEQNSKLKIKRNIYKSNSQMNITNRNKEFLFSKNLFETRIKNTHKKYLESSPYSPYSPYSSVISTNATKKIINSPENNNRSNINNNYSSSMNVSDEQGLNNNNFFVLKDFSYFMKPDKFLSERESKELFLEKISTPYKIHKIKTKPKIINKYKDKEGFMPEIKDEVVCNYGGEYQKYKSCGKNDSYREKLFPPKMNSVIGKKICDGRRTMGKFPSMCYSVIFNNSNRIGHIKKNNTNRIIDMEI